MPDHTHHIDTPTTLNELSASAADQAESPANGGNVLAILASSNRLVLKNGRLSGGRACALSARAASRGIQTIIPRPFLSPLGSTSS